MCNAAQFRPSIVFGPRQGIWAKQNLGPAGPLPLSGATWQTVKLSCVPVSSPRQALDAGLSEFAELQTQLNRPCNPDAYPGSSIGDGDVSRSA